MEEFTHTLTQSDTLPKLRAANDQLRQAQDEVVAAMRHLHFAENAYRREFEASMDATENMAAGGGMKY